MAKRKVLFDGCSYGRYYVSVPEKGVFVAKRTLPCLSRPQAYSIVKGMGMLVSSPDDFAAFLRLLSSGDDVYDATGNKIPRKEVISIYNAITTASSPSRIELLDATFKSIEGVLQFNSRHTYAEGEFRPIVHEVPVYSGLVAGVSEPLEECLMENRGIDLEDWLRNPTKQGLPRKDVKSGRLQYWHPRDRGAVGFIVNSDKVGLKCTLSPKFSRLNLAVRPCILDK